MVNSRKHTKNAEHNTNSWFKIGKNSKYMSKMRHKASSQRESNFEIKLSNKFSALDKAKDSIKHKRQFSHQQKDPN